MAPFVWIDCAVWDGSIFFYKGTKSITRTGLECQRWDKQAPHDHTNTAPRYFYTSESISEMNNFCRNTRPYDSNLPWCYTTSEKTRWQYCDIDQCQPEKDVTGACYRIIQKKGDRGFEDHIYYKGTRNTTLSGYPCQRWDRQSPNEHDQGSKPDHFLTNETLEEVGNYCRAVAGKTMSLPWCYTTDSKKRWEFCIVTQC